MGGCSSKQKKRPISTTINNNNDHQQLMENKRKQHELEHKNNLNQVAINWRSNTLSIWKRTVDKLAIHTDLPRLGHKIDIIDKLGRLNNISFTSVSMGASQSNMSGSPTYNISSGGESLINNTNGDGAGRQQQQQQEEGGVANFTDSTTMNSAGVLVTAQVLKKEEVVLQVLLALARLLDGTEKESQIRLEFSNYIKGAGDMSQQLLQLLENVIGENSRMTQLLKVCHQKIILPSYYFIKANLYEELPFRDKRGSWRLKITFEEDGTVQIIHSKRQQSTTGSESDPEFEFEWNLTVLFDKDMIISHLKVEVVDLIISKNIKPEKRQEIQSAFETLQLATNTSNSNSACFSKQLNSPIPLNQIES